MTTIVPLDLGAAPNDGTGDTLRDGGDIINDNFAALNAGKVEKSGDTMTGQLVIDIETGQNVLDLISTEGSGFRVHRISANATGPVNTFKKSRGTRAVPTFPAQNDQLGLLRFQISETVGSGAGFTAVDVRGQVICAVPSATDAEGRWLVFISPAASVSVTEVLRADVATGFSMFANPVIDQERLHRMRSYTVATLPAAGTAGRRAMVTDANAPTFLATVAGGGAVRTPVFDNGTNWVCA